MNLFWTNKIQLLHIMLCVHALQSNPSCCTYSEPKIQLINVKPSSNKLLCEDSIS